MMYKLFESSVHSWRDTQELMNSDNVDRVVEGWIDFPQSFSIDHLTLLHLSFVI